MRACLRLPVSGLVLVEVQQIIWPLAQLRLLDMMILIAVIVTHMGFRHAQPMVHLAMSVCRVMSRCLGNRSMGIGFLLIWMITLSGCRTYVEQSQQARYDWQRGDLDGAERDLARQVSKHGRGKDEMLWQLELSTIQRLNGNHHDSLLGFQRVEQVLAEEEQRLIGLRSSGMQAASMLSNQANRPYRPRIFEAAMLHAYQALNYWKLDPYGGPREAVRPELAKARRHQQLALERNEQAVREARESIETHPDHNAIERTQAHPSFQAQLSQVQEDLRHLKDYDDFVNPWIEFLTGLYLKMHGVGQSDLEDAILSFRRLQGMVPESAQAWQWELEAIQRRAQGQGEPPQTYVVFETGMIASLEEMRLDIPIVFADVSYIGAAFPKLKFHEDYQPSLQISGAGDSCQTTIVASLDRLAAHAYRQALPMMVSRTLVATVAKGVAAYALNRSAQKQDPVLGLLMRVGTAVAQYAVNIADTRCWTTLPKEIQFCRMETPADGEMTLAYPDGSHVTKLSLEPGQFHVVYVRSLNQHTPMVVEILAL